jgi:hypothetical protein
MTKGGFEGAADEPLTGKSLYLLFSFCATSKTAVASAYGFCLLSFVCGILTAFEKV